MEIIFDNYCANIPRFTRWNIFTITPNQCLNDSNTIILKKIYEFKKFNNVFYVPSFIQKNGYYIRIGLRPTNIITIKNLPYCSFHVFIKNINTYANKN